MVSNIYIPVLSVTCSMYQTSFVELHYCVQNFLCKTLFLAAAVPSGYVLQGVQGFVEELVVNDDPEYQWIDKIRTPRASNEARQRLFSKLSGMTFSFT